MFGSSQKKRFAVEAKGNEKEHYDMSDTTSKAMGNSGFPLKNGEMDKINTKLYCM